MKKYIILGILLLPLCAFGKEINVSAISFKSATNQPSFSVTWENSWTFWAGEPDLYDVAWIWIKYAPNGGDS